MTSRSFVCARAMCGALGETKPGCEGHVQRRAFGATLTWQCRGRSSLTASHRHCRHRCERPLRMDAPSTGWVTALAGLLARGSSPSCVRPSRFPSGHVDAGSPLTVAGAATDFRKFATCERADFRVPSFVPGFTRGTSTLKCSLEAAGQVKRRAGGRTGSRSRFRVGRDEAPSPDCFFVSERFAVDFSPSRQKESFPMTRPKRFAISAFSPPPVCW